MNKKTLVIGASLKPERYSNMVIKKLISHNIEVVAFGLRAGKVSGITIVTEPLQYVNIHTVTLYVNPKNQQQYYNYIVSLQPKRVIFNPGTENPEFYRVLQQYGIAYEVACSLVLLSTNQY